MTDKPYDIAVVGGGCAGFQLLYHLSRQPRWPVRVLLLTDGKPMSRSWCFWGTANHPLQHLVTKSWDRLTVCAPGFDRTESIAPYTYHYLPGEAFFSYFTDTFLPQHPNITVVTAPVDRIDKVDSVFTLTADDQSFTAHQVYASALPEAMQVPTGAGHFHLWQHFSGWFIRTDRPVFDPDAATLMDFRVPQQQAVQFAYVLPFSATHALVEITAFSAEKSYPAARYEALLRDYLHQQMPGVAYTIEAQETGQIPMTNIPFGRYGPAGETLLGTAAGRVKCTSGYAFQRIGRDSAQLARAYAAGTLPALPESASRFAFYDRLLLGILTDQPEAGQAIFRELYANTPYAHVLRFLDEQTTLGDDVRMVSRLPYTPFLRQLIRQWLH